MNVLITGGGGFLGGQLARKLLSLGTLAPSGGPSVPIDKIVLTDFKFGKEVQSVTDSRVVFADGDIGDPAFSSSLLAHSPRVIFHLAAMVSGDGECDFTGCWRTNVEATRDILEACRKANPSSVVVLASSLAVFGGAEMPKIVSDRTKTFPQTTYGMTKLIGELLINDYSRKGFIDGRAARLPTIFIRPGRANAAASSFASGMFRAPLEGQAFLLPVPLTQGVPLLGYRRAVENLVRLAEASVPSLGADRVVTMPSTRYQVSDMIAVLTRIASREGITLGSIGESRDSTIMGIVSTWPEGTEAERARTLGMKADDSVEQVIEDYITDFLRR